MYKYFLANWRFVSLQLFVDCVGELQSDIPLKVNTGLLLGAAAFERALGDVSALRYYFFTVNYHC